VELSCRIGARAHGGTREIACHTAHDRGIRRARIFRPLRLVGRQTMDVEVARRTSARRLDQNEARVNPDADLRETRRRGLPRERAERIPDLERRATRVERMVLERLGEERHHAVALHPRDDTLVLTDRLANPVDR
jgi:hypothetical protein